MPAPTGQDASVNDSDVHVIDIDSDVDQIIATIDSADIPVIHIDKTKPANMNGDGECLLFFFLHTSDVI